MVRGNPYWQLYNGNGFNERYLHLYEGVFTAEV